MTESPRVLILEDETLIAMDLAMTLEEAGLDVVGPFRTAEAALQHLAEGSPDIALLDLNLGGDKTSLPVAERLESLGRPFIFLTGYSASDHPVISRFPDAPRLPKPVDPARITSLISATV